MPWLEITLRLSTALLCGALVGLDRDLRGKPAGLRTLSLVGLGSALITYLGIDLSGAESSTRVLQGIITGIGFLGAGVILHPSSDERVRGLTTAASVWVIACIGAAAGAGRIGVAAIGTALVMLVLLFGGRIERFCESSMREKPRPPEPPLPP